VGGAIGPFHGRQAVAELKQGDARVISGLFSRRVRRTLAAAAPLVVVLWLSGCEYDTYPKDLAYPLRTDLIVVNAPKNETPFYPPGPGHLEEEIEAIPKLGGQVLDPTDSKKVPAAQRRLLFNALNKAFGSPRQPRVGATDGEDPDVVTQLTALKIRDAEGKPFKTLAIGSRVYRYHCVHCHGLNGDGRGPTGPWVVPHPRDYRLGEFKFISSVNAGENTRPRRDDLLRTLHTGIDGTSMPSFAVMEERGDNLEAVVSYVIHLSIRGLVEKRLLVEIAGSPDDYNDEAKMDAEVHTLMTDVIQQWTDSNSKTLEPAKGSYVENPSTKAHADSIRRGYTLFSDPKGAASCIGCHTDYGRQVNFRYDDWGTLVRPMNLTKGVYRGGRRPIDLYWRIKGGIGPSGMPKTGLTEDKDIWDVVNFVQNLPYPQMLPEDVRAKVYGPVGEQSGTERAER
jgi:mono/diheme cytochrome c family protein